MDAKVDYKFCDLVDIGAFERLMKSLYKATGIPNGLVSEEGEILSQVGWVSACAQFHRVNPLSNKQCQDSNLALMRNLHEGKVACDFCKNGLIDYATPVVIEGDRLATLFLGQVLNMPPDMEFFRKQAERFGFDEKSYLEAIRAVPVVESERMESLMDCMVGMAQMLAASGLARLRQNILERDLSQSMEQRIQLKDILDSSPIGIGWSNSHGKIEYVNRQFTALFGYALSDIPNLEEWYMKAFPDKKYRDSIAEHWKKAEPEACCDIGEPLSALEADVVCKNGDKRRVVIRASWVGDIRLVNFSDMTAHWQSEQRNRAHDDMLGMVAKGLPLSDILQAIVKTIESEERGSLCSVLLLDGEGKHLLLGASSGLPAFYNEAINGVEIGIGVGSCGTAAYLKERVVVEDIMTHEYWKPYAKLAHSAGLGACWSEPIISSDGKVLGTFAIYHAEPTKFETQDIERISFAANLAAIAIENRNVRSELERRAYSDYLTGLPNRRHFIEQAEVEISRYRRYGGNLSLIMFDIDYFKKINDTYGHGVGDIVLQKIGDICRDTLRDMDIAGRIGGEEFAVLLPQTDIAEAQITAERLRAAIEDATVESSGGLRLSFTASFGVVGVEKKAVNIDELLAQADSALYRAKENGRNRVCRYGVDIKKDSES